MPWDEALRLTRLLQADPSSAITAALQGWDHPISREAAVLMDLFDLTHTAHSKRPPKPHPGRPMKPTGHVERMGKTGGRTPERLRAILAAARRGIAA